MKPLETLAVVTTPDGATLMLQRHDGDFVIRVDGHVLMSSRSHASESALAAMALENVRARRIASPRILVGGLGLGFTLRTLLEGLPETARVRVAELSPAIVEWNRTFIDARALDDPRVEVTVADVGKELRRRVAAYDAILLDVDNGPSALTQRSNRSLYGALALRQARSLVAPGGVYVVWSAGRDDAFLRRMRESGFEAKMVDAGGGSHVLFVGTAPRATASGTSNRAR